MYCLTVLLTRPNARGHAKTLNFGLKVSFTDRFVFVFAFVYINHRRNVYF